MLFVKVSCIIIQNYTIILNDFMILSHLLSFRQTEQNTTQFGSFNISKVNKLENEIVFLKSQTITDHL